MPEKYYTIPKGMANAFMEGTRRDPSTFSGLEAAMSWLAVELAKMVKKRESLGDFYRSPSLADSYHDNGYNVAIHDIRRMFLAEPEIPEEVKNLMQKWGGKFDEPILEAFRRGQRSKGSV